MRLGLLVLVIFFAGCIPLDPPTAKPVVTEREKLERTQMVIEILNSKPNWVFPADVCPAEIMPKFEQDIEYYSEGCEDDPADCLEKCKAEDGNGCYSLALLIQEQKGLGEEISEALFLRSCKFGIISGCTNRAAGILNLNEGNLEALKCANNTFEKTCLRDDSWGCTMFGSSLAEGLNHNQDFEKALKILSKACKPDAEDDPACQAARKLIEQIENSRKESDDKIGDK